MEDALEEQVRAVIAEHAELPADGAAPLEVESLVLVQIAEDLEARFDFVLRGRELTPEHFGSVAAIVAFVRTKVAP
ncbi:MAG TPA: acyl carrier protein [Polyangiaceae bacterium LLY-WYZ-15_(1-7)]|nr:hypothetical protein [Sandaracinus sp.]HJK92017.1 acyl carrier protein [Polyangiaceae bacterium LLY-WYZ-15_(1-7)]MBJ73727.1 hypothetical protein [Sandaracinus sp.]HJL05812.1 acyl carrier protein [Polyangiaceae bacterium LLY-WYZ-15_(1-7)]HJL13908.1 acyl carrier protein [Polyangiaceae bacterium LLY-WYZ-15_(1-7)]